MKRNIILPIVFGMILALAACSPVTEAAPSESEGSPAYPPVVEQPPAEAYPSAADGQTSEPGPVGAYPAPDSQSPAAGSTNCASVEANELGASIAADYPDLTTPEQVMSWFCAGAEFEDILVALETADQTGADAKEMLAMLAAGLSWEEIWQVVGLTGQP